jgi:hypothetical protein
MKDEKTFKQTNQRRLKPYGEELGRDSIRVRSSDRDYMDCTVKKRIPAEEWRNLKRGPKKKARRKAKEDIKDQVENTNPHIGSTLVSLFDELGEREEFDKLCEKKRSA